MSLLRATMYSTKKEIHMLKFANFILVTVSMIVRFYLPIFFCSDVSHVQYPGPSQILCRYYVYTKEMKLLSRIRKTYFKMSHDQVAKENINIYLHFYTLLQGLMNFVCCLISLLGRYTLTTEYAFLFIIHLLNYKQ
jgi:hypothetical protein